MGGGYASYSMIFLFDCRSEVEEFFAEAMKNDEEGIVVKSMTSLYIPGSRAKNNGWLVRNTFTLYFLSNVSQVIILRKFSGVSITRMARKRQVEMGGRF